MSFKFFWTLSKT